MHGAGSAAAPRPLPCPPTAAGLHSVPRLVHTQPVHKMRRAVLVKLPPGWASGWVPARQTDRCWRACSTTKCAQMWQSECHVGNACVARVMLIDLLAIDSTRNRAIEIAAQEAVGRFLNVHGQVSVKFLNVPRSGAWGLTRPSPAAPATRHPATPATRHTPPRLLRPVGQASRRGRQPGARRRRRIFQSSAAPSRGGQPPS